MTLKAQIEQDLKSALLGGDKDGATTLRGLKSTILYAEITQGKREQGLNDNEVVDLLTKEARKRQESIDLYKQGGDFKRAEQEQQEKTLIERYLPKPLSESELHDLIDDALRATQAQGPKDMGKVIQMVKQKSQGAAEGSLVARLVKERLEA